MKPDGEHELLRSLAEQPQSIDELRDCYQITTGQLDAFLAKLERYGARIHRSATRIHLDADLIDPKRVRALLPRQSIDYRAFVESTNALLLDSAWQATSGSVCVAEYQTAGRGRLGRRWQAPFAGGLCFSILWRFAAAQDLNGLSLAVGAAVAEGLAQCGYQVGLKWPNDIVVDGRKLGGILVQLKRRPQQLRAVIGVGLNVDLGDCVQIDQPWTDLTRLRPGVRPCRSTILAGLIGRIQTALVKFEAEGFPAFWAGWEDIDVLANQAVRVADNGTSIEGVARGINSDGALRVELANGQTVEFVAGEVSVRAA